MARAVLRQLPQAGTRVPRRPQHTFNIKHRPYVIQPFLLAPVLPGETMKNLLMQVRAVTDPIKHPLIGWWLEHYVFYVRHRDMGAQPSQEFQSMMLDATWDSENVVTTNADIKTYFAGNGINWTQYCLQAVVDHYFRDEGTGYGDFQIDGQPIAAINGNSWMDSLILASALEANDIVVDDNEGTTDVMASQVERALRQYELLSMQGLTTMSYEEYLQSFGVRLQLAEADNKPELIRFSREWTYPSNTIDPTNGTPRSACSWSISERADKDRFFKEPGFIFGVTVARPKMYMRNQIGSAAWFMNDAYSWLPAVMADDPRTSLKKVSGSVVSPLTIANADFYVDVRDLLIYGDQFTNYTMADDAGDGSHPLPTAALEKRYLSADTDIDDLFVDDAGGDTGAVNVKQDGVVSLNIWGNQRDTTPTVGRTL